MHKGGGLFEVRLFSSLQHMLGGAGTVWSTSHFYPFNSDAMRTYYANADEVAALGPDECWRALSLVARSVAQFCHCFEAEVICQKDGVEDTKRAGFLPEDLGRREMFVDRLTEWMQDSAECIEAVLLLSSDCGTGGHEPVVKFRYHEEPHRWCLKLTDQEYNEVQAVLVANGFGLLFESREQPQLAYQFAAAA